MECSSAGLYGAQKGKELSVGPSKGGEGKRRKGGENQAAEQRRQLPEKTTGSVFCRTRIFACLCAGAQGAYDVKADIVTYGKTLGGGLPVGVCCGNKEAMTRADPKKAARVAYVIGTFAGHPAVMGSMNAFLKCKRMVGRWAGGWGGEVRRRMEGEERCRVLGGDGTKKGAEAMER